MFAARMKIALAVAVSSVIVLVNGFADTDCRKSEFACDGGRKCLPNRWVCDGELDCRDGTDEKVENCVIKPDRNCTATEYACANKKCLPASWRCDGQDDCGDDSDEVDCPSLCRDDEHTCGDGQCITKQWVCDGMPDCKDGSDERRNCTTSVTSPTVTTPAPPVAGGGSGGGSSGDGVESNATAIEVESPYFFCGDRRRLPKSYRCDGDRDCFDGTDEENCTSTPAPAIVCRSSEYQCSNSYCIMQSWVCDGKADCQEGEDEASCPSGHSCTDGQFTCGSGECVPLHERCNGYADCRDSSDETECDVSVVEVSTAKCNQTTHLQCSGGACIDRKRICDGKNDCGNNQDESELLCGVNECEHSNGGCEHQCVDAKEGYHCVCNAGHRLVGKYSCEDINECEEEPGTCSQVCTNTRGSYHCSCQPGYLRDPADYTRCKAAVGEAYLIFSHSYDIRSLRLRDSDMTSVVSDTHGATALDFHFSKNQILWSDRKEKKIFSAPMSNTRSREVVVAEEEVSADGLAVDWIHGNIYYTDTSHFAVRLVSLDKKYTKTLVTEDLGHPRAIAVSPMSGYVYWSDWGKEPKIERASLDGSQREAIIRDPHVAWPNGITIDHSTDLLYWCDGRLNTISASRLDGSHIKIILFSPSVLRLPYSITVFEDRLYWTDWSQLALYSANKFTGNDVQNVSAGHMLESPKVVHVFHQYRQPVGENVCVDHPCSHICVRSIVGQLLCTCPDGYYLTGNNVTCSVGEDAVLVEAPKAEVSTESISIMNTARGSTKLKPVTASSSVTPRTTARYTTPVPVYRSQRRTAAPLVEAAARTDDADDSDDGPSLGLILGVVLGTLAGLMLGATILMVYGRLRKRNGIKRFRFHNPVYRKTTDDEDGRGFTIAQEQLFYNPTREYGPPDPNLTMTEADDAPLTPDDNTGV